MFSRFILKYFLGYDDVLMNSIKKIADAENNTGMCKNINPSWRPCFPVDGGLSIVVIAFGYTLNPFFLFYSPFLSL